MGENKKNTRDKIIAYATKCFNQEGFGAITIQELANRLEMSRGNLTYYFKTKDDLLEAIVNEMWTRLDEELNKRRTLPSFENLHNTAKVYYRIQKEYSFIFLDQHVLKHELVKGKFREQTKKSIHDNKAALAFAIKLGNLKPEPVPGMYNNIAFITWMMPFYWLNQQIIRGEKTEEDAEKMIWSILLPHFTEKGVSSFIKFFGKEYYESLGESFSVDLDSLISF
ncbi:TetR/AcrR family transcriptional regulator [uncultured Microscilla sp.]|uniref:TetR/AcrR family transcriptional regulator n=1 Tax=uncultured Microscilla sp. TaxID=432653 RepID=UPI00261029C2|nr:TetR/AcrR family transcriptional regulator [uncultured Microscilla sp.]